MSDRPPSPEFPTKSEAVQPQPEKLVEYARDLAFSNPTECFFAENGLLVIPNESTLCHKRGLPRRWILRRLEAMGAKKVKGYERVLTLELPDTPQSLSAAFSCVEGKLFSFVQERVLKERGLDCWDSKGCGYCGEEEEAVDDCRSCDAPCCRACLGNDGAKICHRCTKLLGNNVCAAVELFLRATKKPE